MNSADIDSELTEARTFIATLTPTLDAAEIAWLDQGAKLAETRLPSVSSAPGMSPSRRVHDADG